MMMWVALFAAGCLLVFLPFLLHRAHVARLQALREQWIQKVMASGHEDGVMWRIHTRWSAWERMLSISGVRGSSETIIGVAVVFGVGGAIATSSAFVTMTERFAPATEMLSPWWISVIVGLVCGVLPIGYVVMRAQRVRHRIALALIQLVQTLIGHYRCDQTVLEWISRSGESMPLIIQPEWRRLEMQAVLYSSLEEALYEFAQRMDNGWAEDVADLLMMRHKYGHDVASALQKLMIDLQIAQQQEQKRRAMMTVYRIGTMMMIGFAVFSVYFNIMVESKHFIYYFVHANGKTLIATSVVVLTIAAFLVFRSGKRSF